MGSPIQDAGSGCEWMEMRRGRHERIAIFPKLFYLPGSDSDACELMCTHVYDLLYCYTCLKVKKSLSVS